MEALVHTNPSITVDGVEYPVQRLGLKHMVTFIKVLKGARIVNQFADMMKDMQVKEPEEAAEGEEADPEALAAQLEERQAAAKDRALGAGLNMIFALVEADAEIYQLVASLTGMKKEDAENLPLDKTMELVEIIVDAPDIRAFTEAVQKFLNRKTRPMATIPAKA